MAAFHPHPYNESQTKFSSLWHSKTDFKNVSTKHFSSMIINKHGEELVTLIPSQRINFWGTGKPYYIYTFPW